MYHYSGTSAGYISHLCYNFYHSLQKLMYKKIGKKKMINTDKRPLSDLIPRMITILKKHKNPTTKK